MDIIILICNLVTILVNINVGIYLPEDELNFLFNFWKVINLALFIAKFFENMISPATFFEFYRIGI